MIHFQSIDQYMENENILYWLEVKIYGFFFNLYFYLFDFTKLHSNKPCLVESTKNLINRLRDKFFS